MLQRIWQVIRAAGRSLALAGTIVGVLYLWPDIKGLPEAYGLAWADIMPDREIVAYVLLGWL